MLYRRNYKNVQNVIDILNLFFSVLKTEMSVLIFFLIILSTFLINFYMKSRTQGSPLFDSGYTSLS